LIKTITNILIEIVTIIFVVSVFIGIYIGLEYLGILWLVMAIYWIFILIMSPLLLKAAYMFLKDIHQSNLDDIEEHQLEEKTEQSGMKDLIKSALKRIAELVLYSALFFIMVWGILFIFVPAVELQDLLVFLRAIPVVIIVGLLIEKLVATIRDMLQKNN